MVRWYRALVVVRAVALNRGSHEYRVELSFDDPILNFYSRD